ncbi:hypothetical protein [Actinoplanes couchii]|uniref:Alanine and proline-rich secreted protein Apa n=1 Tax=Actinoplanes couchii TaxID=403638 RepID=A0ABQ3XLH8_9ACTN|nr:hypothetical protein [Actinoplanes couchii]MDR6318267.1 hypothetical protein [Actinoplanes couchii]GID59363.1 hypothetical protein Aco03nite_077670 [Actinoplanes couchii]
MTDLRGHLEDIAGPVTPVAPGQIEADVLRGRRATRQRRSMQAVVGSLFGVAALTAVFTIPSGGVGAGPQGPTAAAPPAVVTAVDLVAYQGAQPKGFTVDKVPAGWFIQSDDNYSLTLAPEKVRNPGPDVDPSAQPEYDPANFVGKIGIFLESRDQSGPGRDGIDLTVGDGTGVLVKHLPPMIPGQPDGDPNGDYGWSLWVPQPSGIWLIVQFPERLDMSREQMAELAAGVHVHRNASQGAG